MLGNIVPLWETTLAAMKLVSGPVVAVGLVLSASLLVEKLGGADIGNRPLLLVAVLAIWLAFHRFGPTISAETAPRRSLTESAEAIGNLQVRLADGGPLVGSYLAYLQGLLRKRFGAQVRLDDPVALARRTGLEEHVIREELRRATELTTQPRTSVSTAAAMVRWLCRLQNRL